MKPQLKERRLLATDTKILENTRRWRRTYNGLVTNLYAKIRERSKRNGRQNHEFTLGEFKAFVAQTDIRRLYERWAKCGFQTDRRPSIDRIDALRGYTFDNMQVITAKENRVKGDAEKMVLWGKPVHQLSMSGVVLAKYPNIHTAMEITRINRNNISSVLHGKRKSAGGYKWEVIGNIYENPELLTESV